MAWKNSHGISERAIECESGETQMQTIEAWVERLPEICKGYKLEDIWNMDESNCFFVHYHTNVFQKKEDVAKEANIQSFV